MPVARRRLMLVQPRAATAAAVALAGSVAAAVQLARQHAVSAWDTVWAEDGYVFLTEAVGGDIVRTIVDPYGGYIHILPRIAAAIAASLPLDLASLVFAVAWAIVVSLLAIFVYFASAGVVHSRPLRLAFGALVAFLPAAGSELVGNAANLHFYLVFACFWAFVWRSITPAALASRAVVVAVTALSDPLTVLFAPLALWNTLARHDRRELVVPAVFVAGLAIQFAAIAVAGEPPQRLTRFDVGHLLPLFALRVTGSLVVGDRFLDDLGFAFGNAFSYGALAAVALVLAVGAANSRRPTQLFAIVSTAYAVVFFVVFLVGRGTAGMRPGVDEATWHLAGARFTYAPILFLSAALLAVFDAHVRPLRLPVRRTAEGATLIVVGILIAANFSFESERSLGPGWQGEFAEARERCTGGADEGRILVAPGPFGFEFVADCRDLR